MASDHKIKISGDFRNITEGFKNLSDSITELSKKKPKLGFDDTEFKKMMDSMTKDISDHQDKLERRVSRLSTISTRVYRDLQKAYEDATDPKRVELLQKRYQGLNKTLADNVRQLKTLQQSQQALGSVLQAGTPAAPVGFMGRAKGVAGELFPRGLPMGGGMLGRAAGMLGPVGLGIGAGVAGLGLAYGLGSTRRQIAGEGLALRAFGSRTGAQIEGLRETGLSRGFSPMESIRQAVELEKATGVNSGRRGFGGMSALEQAQRLGRGFGMDVGQVTGMAGQLRGAGLRGDESLRKLRDIFVQGTALGVERARLPEFAQAQIGYLEQQASQGEASIKGLEALNAMLSNNKFFADDPRRGINVAQGLEAAFGEKQGPGALAAFQTINELSGGSVTPGQTLLIKRKGLLKGLEAMNVDINEGIELFVKNLGKIKLGKEVDVNRLQKGTEEYALMVLSLQDAMQIQDPALVEQMLDAMKGDGKITKEWMKKKIDAADKSKSILDKVMNNQDMQMKRLEGALQEFKMDTGDIANAITSGLHQFADNLMRDFKDSILDMISFNPMKSAKRKFQGDQNAAAISVEDIINAAGGDRSKAFQFQQGQFKEKYDRYQQIDSELQMLRVQDEKEGPSWFSTTDTERKIEELEEEKKRLLMEEIPKEKLKLEAISGRRYKLHEASTAQFESDFATQDLTNPLSKTERESLEKEKAKVTSEEQEKLKGREQPISGKSSSFSQESTVPGTNVLVAPINRLRDSIDKLNDTISSQNNSRNVRPGRSRNSEDVRVR